MIPLPIDSWTARIIESLKSHPSIVIVAQPGAGKTTRIPPAIVKSGLLPKNHPNLVMLQPRRVAARAAAQRIAEENGWEVGREVGYHIRFEKRVGPQTRLRVLTEGVLTRQLLDDPFLQGVGAVVLDEFHERSLHSDLAIAMLRELRQTVRPDLIIVVMSATLQAQTVAEFLSDCPMMNVPGRTFPVEIEHKPHGHLPIVDRVCAAVEEQISSSATTGDILVFLPGADEIRRTMRRLENSAQRNNLAILPLHGSLPADQQTLALRPSAQRKIILATNIAETSLTIDGVTAVIDSGLARIPRFDPQRGLDRLELKRISKASAAQRAGRAGRTAPGKCVRLWSAKEQADLEDYESPEINRVDLCQALLDLHAWGKPNPNTFGWFQPPPPSSIQSAQKLLEMLGAVINASLTPLGRRLMKLPLHPRVGRLLCAAADAGCPDEGAALAALLSEKDIFRPNPSDRIPTMQADSDLLLRLDYLANSRHHPQLDPIAIRLVRQAQDQLQKIARRLTHRAPTPPMPPSPDTLMKLILWAYPDRVCRRRESDPAAAVMVGGGGIRLAPESVVRQPEFFLALDARHDPRSESREAVVRVASSIELPWLHQMFPNSINRHRQTLFDEHRQRVVGQDIVCYLDLTLSETRDAPVDPRQAGQTLAAALRPKAPEIFAADEKSATFLARVQFLRQWMPEHPWPRFDKEQLGEILTELCQNKRSVEELMRLPLSDALAAHVTYPLDRILRDHAPESLAVPSGSQIRLTYTPAQPPVLAVRLQEIFGLSDTPRLAAGRVPVLLHLLGPNYRTVQITDDLRSFWSTAYFQVRKDLRVRYPKHSWPDDPTTATPQAKGTRKK